LGKFIPKITNNCDFGTYKSTFLKATTVKFAVTWDTLPALNFVKIAQKMLKVLAGIALPQR